MRKMLSKEFFNRPTPTVAQGLIGKHLVRRRRGREEAYLITEAEAYAGPEDLASHARHGKTARNAPMWEEPGTIYVYFCYGVHWMLNVVVGGKGSPGAVLIRGAIFSNSQESQNEIRRGNVEKRTNYRGRSSVVLEGPGKLTKALKVDGALTGRPLGKASGLWIEDRGVAVPRKHLQKTPRIGVAYAGAHAAKKWRFVYKKSVSKK